MILRKRPGSPSLRADVRAIARGWRWGRRPLVPRAAEPRTLAPRDYPTAWARTQTAIAARAVVQRFALGPIIALETERRVEGEDVLDAVRPPVIFVANHTSHLDAPLVLTSLPSRWAERTATGAAADYFFDVWWRAAATALVFNAFPVERSRTRGRTTTLARELLAEGWNILMFPEGTRSADGWGSDLRLGAARLAVTSGVPVVPIGIRGSYQAMPRGAAWPARGRPPVRVRFGRPVTPVVDEDPVAFTARIRDALALVLQEDRSTWWDAQRRAAVGGLTPIEGPEAAVWRRRWEASRPMPTHPTAFRRR